MSLPSKSIPFNAKKANSGVSIQFGLSNLKKDENIGLSAPAQNVFKIDDDEEEECQTAPMPPNAKVSKNIGRLTATSGSTFYFPAGTIHTMETKTHHLHRPVNDYFKDKLEIEEMKSKEAAAAEKEKRAQNSITKEKEKSVNNSKTKDMGELKTQIKKLHEMIKIHQRKIKICYICRRKFAGIEHFRNHEHHSSLHQNHINNLPKNKNNNQTRIKNNKLT